MLDKIVSEFRAISVQEAREMAELSSGSLRRLLRQGRIEGQRVGRAWAVDVQPLFTYLLAAWSPQDLSGHTAHLLDYVTTHYLPRDRFDQAEALLKHLLAAYEARFGCEHPYTFPVLASLAKVYARPYRFAEAIVLFQRLLTLQEKHLGRITRLSSARFTAWRRSLSSKTTTARSNSTPCVLCVWLNSCQSRNSPRWRSCSMSWRISTRSRISTDKPRRC